MSLANMLVQGAMSTAQQTGSGLADSVAKGSQLALQAEELQMKKQQLVSQQKQLADAKMTKWWDAMTAANNSKDPRARSLFYKHAAPKMRDALGLEISDDFIKLFSSSEDIQAKAETLKNMYAQGEISLQELTATMNDEVALMSVEALPPELMGSEAMSVAAATKERASTARTKMTADAAAGRQQTDISSTANVKVAGEVGKAYAQYNVAGGAGAYKKAVQGYEEAIKDLGGVKDPKTGKWTYDDSKAKVKLGTWDKNIPFGSTEPVLARTDKKAKALVDKIRDNINIRAKTGDPNPATIQIEQILSRSIDPILSNNANIEKLAAEIERMKAEDAGKRAQFKRSRLPMDDDDAAPEQPPGPPPLQTGFEKVDAAGAAFMRP